MHNASETTDAEFTYDVSEVFAWGFGGLSLPGTLALRVQRSSTKALLTEVPKGPSVSHHLSTDAWHTGPGDISQTGPSSVSNSDWSGDFISDMRSRDGREEKEYGKEFGE